MRQSIRYALLLCILLLAITVAPLPTTAGTTVNQPHPESEQLTPLPGSPLRRQILDALRLEVQRLLGVKAHFVVDHLKVKDGWCWITTRPQSPDGLDHYEDISALLHDDGGWKIQEIPCTEPENPECFDSPDYFTLLLARFPAIPQEILPGPGRTADQ